MALRLITKLLQAILRKLLNIMPLPTPNSNERKEDFISRCMGDPKMLGEYSDNDQRAAICERIYVKQKLQAASTSNDRRIQQPNDESSSTFNT